MRCTIGHGSTAYPERLIGSEPSWPQGGWVQRSWSKSPCATATSVRFGELVRFSIEKTCPPRCCGRSRARSGLPPASSRGTPRGRSAGLSTAVGVSCGMMVRDAAPIRLHEDSSLFREAVTYTAAVTGFGPRLIEKDYFCTVLLQCLGAA